MSLQFAHTHILNWFYAPLGIFRESRKSLMNTFGLFHFEANGNLIVQTVLSVIKSVTDTEREKSMASIAQQITKQESGRQVDNRNLILLM